MKKAVQLKITGSVQGVFFRQSALEKSRELGITGWVRNCEDGSVELEAVGEEDLLNAFVKWCHRGPQRSVVAKVEVSAVEAKEYGGFEIKR
jgi:acylphosphatase